MRLFRHARLRSKLVLARGVMRKHVKRGNPPFNSNEWRRVIARLAGGTHPISTALAME